MNPLLTDSRRQALRSASHWYAVLSGERVSPQQEARWQQWYEQDQDNQWAWQQVENLRNQLGGVPGDVASRALHDTRLTRDVYKRQPLVIDSVTSDSEFPIP